MTCRRQLRGHCPALAPWKSQASSPRRLPAVSEQMRRRVFNGYATCSGQVLIWMPIVWPTVAVIAKLRHFATEPIRRARDARRRTFPWEKCHG